MGWIGTRGFGEKVRGQFKALNFPSARPILWFIGEGRRFQGGLLFSFREGEGLRKFN